MNQPSSVREDPRSVSGVLTADTAQIFIRWSRGGVWERLLALVQERGVQLGMVFLDGTNMRAHQKAAGAAKRGDLQPSEMIVRLLADRVAGMGPRPA